MRAKEERGMEIETANTIETTKAATDSHTMATLL